jgi:hypothetical protein
MGMLQKKVDKVGVQDYIKGYKGCVKGEGYVV